MSIKYEYDPQKNILFVMPSGSIDISDFGDYYKKAANDPSVENKCIELIDFKNIDNFNFTVSEAGQLPSLYQTLKQSKKIRATIIIGYNGLKFGIARTIESYFYYSDFKDKIWTVSSHEEANEIIKKLTAPPISL